MKRVFAAGMLIAFLAGVGAHAQPVTVEDLRVQIMAGETEAVEAALARHQAAFVAGEVSSPDARLPYQVFETTHPAVHDFTDKWLKEMPKSPYAQTAQAMILLNMGGSLRGERSGRDTHRKAHSAHRVMHGDALKLGLQAYHSAPDLLAASDVVILLGNTGGDKGRSIEVLEEVMARRPNYLTIRKAFLLTAEGWGGGPEVRAYLCDVLAPLVTEETYDVPRYCEMDLMARMGGPEGWSDRLEVLLNESDIPDEAYFRHRVAMMTYPPTAQSAADVYAYMQNDWYTDVRRAQIFDRHIAPGFGYDKMEYEVLEKRKAEARGLLVHDPLNLALLEVLEQMSMTVERTETGHTMTPVKGSPTELEKLEYAKRRILVAPYEGDHWAALARHVSAQVRKLGRSGRDLMASDPYYINAIYYGQHRFGYLLSLQGSKHGQLVNFDHAVEYEVDEKGWDHARATIDRDADLMCPIIRLDRLALAQAGQTRESRGVDDATGAVMEVYYKDAEQRDVCKVARNSTLEALEYGPVDVSIVTQFGSLAAGLN